MFCWLASRPAPGAQPKLVAAYQPSRHQSHSTGPVDCTSRNTLVGATGPPLARNTRDVACLPLVSSKEPGPVEPRGLKLVEKDTRAAPIALVLFG